MTSIINTLNTRIAEQDDREVKQTKRIKHLLARIAELERYIYILIDTFVPSSKPKNPGPVTTYTENELCMTCAVSCLVTCLVTMWFLW